MKFLLSILLTFLFCSSISAQNNLQSLDQKYAHQLQLVDAVRAYIQNELHLNTGDDFYTKWSTKKDSMYYYLYIAKPDEVAVPESNLTYAMYNTEDSAIAVANDLKKKGYHTLIYKTAGNSTAELSEKLLSYPDEAISFIMVHEAVHRQIRSSRLYPGYPYVYEECLCDAMANKTCLAIAKTLKILDVKVVTRQTRFFEKAFAYLNHQREKLDTSNANDKAEILKRCTVRIKKMMRNGNQFQKDRMIYEVNNAYFLRIESYAAHYFEVKKMLDNGLTLDEVIAGIYEMRFKNRF